MQSDSSYTVITHTYMVMKYVAGSQANFRVRAIIGRYYDGQYAPDSRHVYIAGDTTGTSLMFVDDVLSGWIGVQTFTVPEVSLSSPFPSQTAALPMLSVTSNGSQPQSSNQTQQPPNTIFAQPVFFVLVGVILGGASAIAIMLLLKRQLKPQFQHPNHQTQYPKH